MPFMNKRLDDPRWVGARRITSPGAMGGTGEHALFRAVYGPHPTGAVPGNCLFMSWQVKIDAQLNRLNDYLVVGLHNPTIAPKKALVFKILPYLVAPPAAASPLVGATDFDVAWYEGTESGGMWTFVRNDALTKKWLDPDVTTSPSQGFTRVWADSTTNKWAIQIFVPMTVAAAAQPWDDQGVDLDLPFKFFYHLQVAMPGPGSYGVQWPTLPAVPSTPANFPNPDTQWGTVEFGGAMDPACSAGISLDRYDVGVAHPPSSALTGTISFESGWWNPMPPTQPVNEFHAKPWNRTGNALGANELAARFRLANWGSLPDWDDPTLQAQLWTDIRGGGNVENTAAVPNNTQGDISFNWQLQNIPGELPDYVPQPPATASRRPHQCMLVELSAGTAAAGPLSFVNDSVYRNLNFIEASEFEQDADISVVTLGSLGAAPDRDVYLYLEALNMPTQTTPRDEGARREEAEAAIRERERVISKEPPRKPPDGFDVRIPQIVGTPEWLVPPPEDLERLEPMFRVHVWHETGETVTEEDGSVRRVLRAQTSFGYVVKHDGPLYGWEPKLTGPGLVEIAPRFYRLSVPVESTATVTSQITAHEKPQRGFDLRTCLMWLLGLLAVVLPFLRKRLKK
jgi:hypothetical protein